MLVVPLPSLMQMPLTQSLGAVQTLPEASFGVHWPAMQV
jgi:hypothetical protein